MPFFSIVIPTFNSEKDIGRCCASIVHQTCKDFEIIVQDGRSQDGTLGRIEQIRDQNPAVPVRVFSEADKGIYDAMNKAILHSSAQWLLFLGSDDALYDNNVLSDMYVQLQHVSANMVYGNVQLSGDMSWGKSGTVYDGPFSPAKLFDRNICHQAVFYNRQLFDQIGFFNQRYAVCADWEYNLRCFAKTEVLYMDRVISIFSTGGLSTSGTGTDAFRNDSIFILKDYFRIGFFSRLFKHHNWVFLHHAILHYKQKRFLQSFRYLVYSFWHAENKFLFIKIVIRMLLGGSLHTA